MNKEIERKFAVKFLPDDIKFEKIENIEQAFIYKDENTLIRIRKIEIEESVNYVYTLKTRGDIQYDNNYKTGKAYEIEYDISKEYFEILLPQKISNIIRKTRVVIPIQNNLKVEMDIYYDYLDGFLTAEIEFPNEKDANEFILPDWLGKEIGYKEFSNNKLSQMSKEEFKNKVSEEFLNNNKIIINKINQLIKTSY